MITIRRALAFLLLLAVLPGAHALEVSGVGRFDKLVPGAEKPVPATQASLADKVTYHFLMSGVSGEHRLLIVIYDGGGREVYRSLSTLVGQLGPVGRAVSYGFDRARDMAGTWWYVVHLDDRIVLSNSIDVQP